MDIKVELFNHIIAICNNLPCPNCATHASEYMKKIYPSSIQTKDDLKNMLFQFHNEVNARTSAPQFSYFELETKYSNANTVNIFKNFFIMFKDNSFNVTAISNTMHRERIVQSFKNWLQTNIDCFNL